MFDLRYAIWAAAAGSLIPVMAVLNARLGRALGEPVQAAVILFGVGLLFASIVSLLITGGLPALGKLAGTSPLNFIGGMIVATYVITVTILAPRFGIGNTILFAVAAQICTAAVIDHFALFGAAHRPVSVMRVVGVVVMVAGLVIAQLAATTPPPSPQ